MSRQAFPLNYSISIFIFINNNNKSLPRFKCFNSRSPLPFLIDLSPIAHVKALPDYVRLGSVS
ncbi:hypothetical protein HanIR_Chr03g0103981 [Helianthus annuus]|nr:hypothetical protein HanIR_Chr03g0103981 [Helianthus annuus]